MHASRCSLSDKAWKKLREHLGLCSLIWWCIGLLYSCSVDHLVCFCLLVCFIANLMKNQDELFTRKYSIKTKWDVLNRRNFLRSRVPARWEDEKRPESYLIPEFMNQIAEGEVKYKLQIQLHEIKPDDSHLILHAARAWDQKTHPWLDLADVTLTSVLPIEIVERTRYSLEHRPLSLGIPPADTIYDYNSIAYLRSKIYPTSNMMSSNRPRKKVSREQMLSEVSYCVKVKTGNRKGAGTDAKVALTITGKPSKSTVYKMAAIRFHLPRKYKRNHAQHYLSFFS